MSAMFVPVRICILKRTEICKSIISAVCLEDPGMSLWNGQYVITVSKTVKHIKIRDFLSTIAVNCTEPPERPGSGTWEWNGEYKYGTYIVYTCGPFGNFMNESGYKYPVTVASCSWDQAWDPPQLDPCVATSCQVKPGGRRRTIIHNTMHIHRLSLFLILKQE